MIFHFRPRQNSNLEAMNDVLRAAEQEACRLGEAEYNRIALAVNMLIPTFSHERQLNYPCREVAIAASYVHRFRKYFYIRAEMLRIDPANFTRTYENVATTDEGTLPSPPGILYDDN